MLKRISSSFNLVIQFQGPGSGGLGRSRRHQATRSPATQNRRGRTTPSPATRNRRGRSPEQPPEPGATTAETNRGKIEAFFYLLFRFRCGRECWKGARFFTGQGNEPGSFCFTYFYLSLYRRATADYRLAFIWEKVAFVCCWKKFCTANPSDSPD